MIKILSLTSWRRFAQGGFLALAMLATGGAWAQAQVCDVTLSAMLPGNQAVLKAVCGGSSTQMKSITWTSDASGATLIPPLVPVVFGPFIFPPTTADLFFTTLLVNGTHSYTASGLDSSGATVNAGKAAVITLIQPALTVTATAGGSVGSNPSGIFNCTSAGAGSPSCVHNYDPGTNVTLTATPTSGNVFSSWSGDCAGAVATCSVSMTVARSVTATFAPIPQVTVTGMASGSGTVSCNSPVNQGSTSTCSVTAFSGWTFTGATSNNCGGPFSGSSFNTGPVNSNCIVTGTFTQNPTNFAVTTVANPVNGGTVTCTPNPVNAGGNSSCTATPNSGFTVTNVTSTCPGQPFGTTQFSIVGINAACSATGNFTQATSSFTVTGAASGSGSVSCSPSSVAGGGTSTCTATTSGGSTLTGFSSTCGGSQSGSNFTTGPVNSACTVTGNFSGGSSASCGAGETFSGGDADWSPLTSTKIFPSQAISASGDFGRAVRFIADATTYPGGVTMTLVDQSSATLPKDVVISACPHNFTPVGNNSACALSGVATNQGVLLKFGPAQRFYDCPLTPGGTYYLNFRDYNTPRGTVSSQFTVYPR